MACVPFTSDIASLGMSSSGAMPASERASPAGLCPSSACIRPSPINGRAICANRARSPLAPTEPCLGTTGCTRLLSIERSVSTSSGRTAEYPFARALALNNIIALTTSVGSGSPTLHAWLLRRLTWSAWISSFGMRTSNRSPTPVFTAYTVTPFARSASSDDLQATILERTSEGSSTVAP